jgi:hypothetical protein
MPDRLAEIRARLDAATPGPWTTDRSPLADDGNSAWFPECGYFYEVTAPRLQKYVAEAYGHEPADAELIAHAPADIAWLLGEVERLAARVRMYEEVKS